MYSTRVSHSYSRRVLPVARLFLTDNEEGQVSAGALHAVDDDGRLARLDGHVEVGPAQ